MAKGRIGPLAWREGGREREREGGKRERVRGEGRGREGEIGHEMVKLRQWCCYSQQWMVYTCSVLLQSPGLYYGSHWWRHTPLCS